MTTNTSQVHPTALRSQIDPVETLTGVGARESSPVHITKLAVDPDTGRVDRRDVKDEDSRAIKRRPRFDVHVHVTDHSGPAVVQVDRTDYTERITKAEGALKFGEKVSADGAWEERWVSEDSASGSPVRGQSVGFDFRQGQRWEEEWENVCDVTTGELLRREVRKRVSRHRRVPFPGNPRAALGMTDEERAKALLMGCVVDFDSEAVESWQTVHLVYPDGTVVTLSTGVREDQTEWRERIRQVRSVSEDRLEDPLERYVEEHYPSGAVRTYSVDRITVREARRKMLNGTKREHQKSLSMSDSDAEVDLIAEKWTSDSQNQWEDRYAIRPGGSEGVGGFKEGIDADGTEWSETWTKSRLGRMKRTVINKSHEWHREEVRIESEGAKTVRRREQHVSGMRGVSLEPLRFLLGGEILSPSGAVENNESVNEQWTEGADGDLKGEKSVVQVHQPSADTIEVTKATEDWGDGVWHRSGHRYFVSTNTMEVTMVSAFSEDKKSDAASTTGTREEIQYHFHDDPVPLSECTSTACLDSRLSEDSPHSSARDNWTLESDGNTWGDKTIKERDGTMRYEHWYENQRGMKETDCWTISGNGQRRGNKLGSRPEGNGRFVVWKERWSELELETKHYDKSWEVYEEGKAEPVESRGEKEGATADHEYMEQWGDEVRFNERVVWVFRQRTEPNGTSIVEREGRTEASGQVVSWYNNHSGYYAGGAEEWADEKGGDTEGDWTSKWNNREHHKFAEKSGTNAEGSWFEAWEEGDEPDGTVHAKANKTGSTRDGRQWEESWVECAFADGSVKKTATKRGSTLMDAWEEHWGDDLSAPDHDGRRAGVKWSRRKAVDGATGDDQLIIMLNT
eukprot:GHVH01001277.1.p1 GENE.GHVH01001277.1~~GHVH01001277.1.p1  ORF type:complete len:853 (+),score=163.89 GHVH01001277.1:66-2624(+)